MIRILVASHTYIVDLNCEKLRELAKLEPEIEVTIVVPRRWKPGGVQNKIVETKPRQEENFRVVPVFNFSQNHQGLAYYPKLEGLSKQDDSHQGPAPALQSFAIILEH